MTSFGPQLYGLFVQISQERSVILDAEEVIFSVLFAADKSAKTRNPLSRKGKHIFLRNRLTQRKYHLLHHSFLLYIIQYLYYCTVNSLLIHHSDSYLHTYAATIYIYIHVHFIHMIAAYDILQYLNWGFVGSQQHMRSGARRTMLIHRLILVGQR